MGEGRPQDVRPAVQPSLVHLVEDQPGRAERRRHPLVGQLDPLRPPGRAAGHHQHGDVPGVLQRRTRRPRDGLRRQRPVGAGPQRDRADRPRRDEHRVAGPVLVFRHHHVRRQVDDVLLQADVTQVRAQRHHLAPGAEGGDQGHQRTGPVAEHDPDPAGSGMRGQQGVQVGQGIGVERPRERQARRRTARSRPDRAPPSDGSGATATSRAPASWGRSSVQSSSQWHDEIIRYNQITKRNSCRLPNRDAP